MSSENDSVSPPVNFEKCSLVLVDVAGTTTSIDFVKDTLFPFVIKQADAFLQAKWDEEAVKECIQQIKEDGADLDVAGAVERVKTLTEQQSSNKGLKTLQGLIYKDGYEKGDLKAHVFDDVPGAFEAWAKNRRVAIYSTGSIDSQKLLFSHTTQGDLSGHISTYFDQTVGPKTEAESYKKIAQETKVEPEEIVFITDDSKEATAAKSGGVTAVLINREGNPPHPDGISKDFTVISSFKDLGLDKTSKRKNEEQSTSTEAPPAKILKTEVENAEVPEKVEEKAESMEVDSAPEKTTTAIEETEKPTETSIEKTEPETKKESSGDVEMKEAKAEEKVETVADEAKKSTEEILPVTKEAQATKEGSQAQATTDEAKPTTEESQTPAKEEKKVVEETQTAETKSSEEMQISEEEKPAADDAQTTTEGETKTATETAKSTSEEAPTTSQDDTSEKTPTNEKEEAKPASDEAKTVTTEEAKPSAAEENEAKPEEEKPKKVEETQTAAEEKTTEEPKSEKPDEEKTETVPDEAAKVADEKPTENGDETTEAEEAETSTTKTEEKENKSVLANGVENGKDESEVDNNAGESAEIKTDDVDKDDESDVKVKKLEESADSKTVSVEV